MEYKVEDTELTLIADAIRSACNLSDELEFPSDFIAKINTLNSAYVGEDESPYLLRQSPTDFGSNYNSEFDTLIGGTIAWNQLQNGVGATSTVYNVTFTKTNDYTLTINGTPSQNVSRRFNDNAPITIVNGHKYFIRGNASNYERLEMRLYQNGWGSALPNVINLSGGIAVATMDSNDAYLVVQLGGGVAYNNVPIIPQIIDLTAFNSDIADYVYSLEQSTAGSGVAWLKEHFPKLFDEYHAYDAGSLVSVKTSEHRTTGKNLLKNNMSSSTQNGLTFTVNADGSVRVSGTATASTYKNINNNLVIPDGNYIVSGMKRYGPYYIYLNARRADGGMDYSYGSTNSRENFIADASVHPSYAVGIGVENGTTLDVTFYPMVRRADIQDSTYEPYTEHSYSLDSDLELRGIPKLSNGSLYYDGDEYTADGTVTRKYGIVDLGTLNYSYQSANGAFVVQLPTKKNGQQNILCSKYTNSPKGSVAEMPDKTVKGNDGNNYINFKDASYNGDTSAFKTAMSGIYLVYELATPTTETADPFASPQIVDPNGTEEYVDTRSVPVPVGHRTEYDYRREVV